MRQRLQNTSTRGSTRATVNLSSSTGTSQLLTRALSSDTYIRNERTHDLLFRLLGNCPNTDVLVSNKAGTRFAHIQVKTYRPGRDQTVTVGPKAERSNGTSFFWVLAGIPEATSNAGWEYYIIPFADFSTIVRENHQRWMATPGRNGQAHNDSAVRAVAVPPHTRPYTVHSIEQYHERWDLIIDACVVM